MTPSAPSLIKRRSFLAEMGAVAAAPTIASLAFPAAAQSGGPINYITWSAAVDQAKAHVASFEKATGIKVNYSNFPAAQFRATLVTKLAGNEPLDLMWMNDAWTPEFADAGWIKPIDDIPALMKNNADTDKYCIDAMTYKGRQYGLVYYTDYIAFMYNTDMLKKAGFSAPPATWEEVVQQSLKMKELGISDHPMVMPLAADAWLIEMIGALVYSFGGKYVDSSGKSALGDAGNGTRRAAQWLTDAINKHKIMSPGTLTTTEVDALKAFGNGQSAFALLARYRIRPLNDSTQSKMAGKVRMALMPAGTGAGSGNYTCGWVRYYGMTPHARANKAREEATIKLMDWFGGKANGEYAFQKSLLLEVGVPFCITSLKNDKEVLAFYDKWAGGIDIVNRQLGMVVKKDVIQPWFGEWNETNNQVWQSIALGRTSPAAGLKASGDKWDDLKKQFS